MSVRCVSSPIVEQCAMRASSVHVRHASVEVQVQCVNIVIGVIGVVLGELVVVRVVPVLLVVML